VSNLRAANHDIKDASMPDELPDPDLVRYAQLSLYVHDREVRYFEASPKRSELVLADAGLSISVIAALTGRKYETVKTAIRRARTTAPKEGG
jgi:DNA-directed RNA polymerase specialized sigma24 family protein